MRFLWTLELLNWISGSQTLSRCVLRHSAMNEGTSWPQPHGVSLHESFHLLIPCLSCDRELAAWCLKAWLARVQIVMGLRLSPDSYHPNAGGRRPKRDISRICPSCDATTSPPLPGRAVFVSLPDETQPFYFLLDGKRAIQLQRLS